MFKAISDNINLAKEILLNGEPIIYPTDTLYSFGAIANDNKAIGKINKLKKRKSPISIVLSDIKNIETYIESSDKKLIKKIIILYMVEVMNKLKYLKKKIKMPI